MHFLQRHERTTQSLQMWAGEDREVILASFFFWAAGNDLQKSLQGLCRSLLHQILRPRPHLIRDIFSRRWGLANQDPQQTGMTWSLVELEEGLVRLVNLQDDRAGFCFFVDGLDEASDELDEASVDDTIVPCLDRLSQATSAKFCVASRPWNQFSLVYGRESNTYIRLEDLNGPAIRTLAHDKLNYMHGLYHSSLTASDLSSLTNEICERAEGVFLWVMLALNAIHRKIGEGERIESLRKSLKDLPKKLNALFQSIFDGIDEKYRKLAGRILLFSLEQQAGGIPASWVVCLETEIEQPDYALQMQRKPLSKQGRRALVDYAKTVLNKCTRDLLTVNESPNMIGQPLSPFDCWVGLHGVVGFSRRAVYDFVRETRGKILEMAGEGFDTRLSRWRILLRSACDADTYGTLQPYLIRILGQIGRTPPGALAWDHHEANLIYMAIDEIHRSLPPTSVGTIPLHWGSTLLTTAGMLQHQLHHRHVISPIGFPAPFLVVLLYSNLHVEFLGFLENVPQEVVEMHKNDWLLASITIARGPQPVLPRSPLVIRTLLELDANLHSTLTRSHGPSERPVTSAWQVLLVKLYAHLTTLGSLLAEDMTSYLELLEWILRTGQANAHTKLWWQDVEETHDRSQLLTSCQAPLRHGWMRAIDMFDVRYQVKHQERIDHSMTSSVEVKTVFSRLRQVHAILLAAPEPSTASGRQVSSQGITRGDNRSALVHRKRRHSSMCMQDRKQRVDK